MTPRVNVVIVGYQPNPGVPLDDYPDFGIGNTYTLEEISLMADAGNLPPGLLLQGRAGGQKSPVCVVRGRYYQPQEVEVI